MKFESKWSMEFDRPAAILRVTGKDADGHPLVAEIPVPEPRTLFMVLAHLIQKEAPTNDREIIPISRMQMGVAQDTSTGAPGAAIFEFGVNGLTMRFAAPLDGADKEVGAEIEKRMTELSTLLFPTPNVAKN